MSSKGSIFISAGDPSADSPGKKLIDEILPVCPQLKISGLGGPLMQKAGLSALADYRQLAVLGFWEILPKYFFFRRLLAECARRIEQDRPRAIILMDYPGFNLRLAKKVKRLGIPIIYYISPQVWAWGKRRIKTIARTIDLMLVIFPFEEEFYRKQGVPCVYTGHPVADRFADIPDRIACRKKIGFDQADRVIGLLPGSRRQELYRMLPVMVETSDRIGREIENSKFVVAAVKSIDRDIYKKMIGNRNIEIVAGLTPEVMKGSDLIITASGTATVETAFFTTPMIIIYKTGSLTYQIAKRLVKLESIGMANIIAGKRVVPELIQGEATSAAIAGEAIDILSDSSKYERMKADLEDVRDKLGTGDSSKTAFDAIREVVPLC